jgi:hypothetical protein
MGSLIGDSEMKAIFDRPAHDALTKRKHVFRSSGRFASERSGSNFDLRQGRQNSFLIGIATGNCFIPSGSFRLQIFDIFTKFRCGCRRRDMWLDQRDIEGKIPD